MKSLSKIIRSPRGTLNEFDFGDFEIKRMFVVSDVPAHETQVPEQSFPLPEEAKQPSILHRNGDRNNLAEVRLQEMLPRVWVDVLQIRLKQTT